MLSVLLRKLKIKTVFFHIHEILKKVRMKYNMFIEINMSDDPV